MAHGDEEALPREEHDLAEADLLLGVVVADGLQDDEGDVAVALELRALVGAERVLDGQRVQGELVAQRRELLRRGLVEVDPDEGAGLLARLAGVVERQVAAPPAVLVHGALDDHGEEPRR